MVGCLLCSGWVVLVVCGLGICFWLLLCWVGFVLCVVIVCGEV